MKNDKSDGFHKTEVGWIPKDWDCIELGRACINGGKYGAAAPSIDYSPELPRYIRITDITDDGRLSSIDIKSIRNEDAKDYLLEEGDFLIARTGATVGKTYLHNKTGNFAFAGYLISFIPNPEQLLGSYLSNFTQSEKYWAWVRSTIHTGAQPNINAQEYSRLYIPLPSIDEQWAIIQVLSTWDRVIERAQWLIEAKQRQKKGLMKGLLTGRLRFPAFGEPVYSVGDIPIGWKETKLNNVADIIVSNVDKLTYENEPDVLLCNYMDVYSNEYITNKIEFMRATASQPEISKYRLVRGDVLLTKDSETSEDIASTAVLMEDIDNLLCGYHLAILRPKKDMVNPVFLSKHLSFGKTHKHFVTHANGVTRYGLSLSAIINTPICLPCFEEQSKIANLIMIIDREITMYSQMLEMYARQKNGLMQKLLTGEIRVKVD